MDDIKKFCHNYDAYVRESSRIHRRAKRIDYKMWSDSDTDFFQSIPYEEVKCVEIHMPEDRFRALLEHEDWVKNAGLQNNSFFANNVSRVSQMIVDHDRECRIRHANPAVRAAYEKYQTLLRLVDSHYD